MDYKTILLEFPVSTQSIEKYGAENLRTLIENVLVRYANEEHFDLNVLGEKTLTKEERETLVQMKNNYEHYLERANEVDGQSRQLLFYEWVKAGQPTE